MIDQPRQVDWPWRLPWEAQGWWTGDTSRLVFHLWYCPDTHWEAIEDIYVFPDGRIATHITKTKACPVRGRLIVYLGSCRGVIWTVTPPGDREVDSYADD